MKRHSKMLVLALVYMALALAVLIAWAAWENTPPVVTEVTVASP